MPIKNPMREEGKMDEAEKASTGLAMAIMANLCGARITDASVHEAHPDLAIVKRLLAPLYSELASLTQRLAEAEAEQQRLRHGRDLAVSARDLAQRTLKAAENIINTYPEYEGKLPHDAFFIAIQRLEEATRRAEQLQRDYAACEGENDAYEAAVRRLDAENLTLTRQAKELAQRAKRAEAERDALLLKPGTPGSTWQGEKAELRNWQIRAETAEAQVATLQRERKERARAFRFDNSDRVIDLLKGDLELERAARQKAEEARKKLWLVLNGLQLEAKAVLTWKAEVQQIIGVTNLRVFERKIAEAEAALTEEPGRGKAKDPQHMTAACFYDDHARYRRPADWCKCECHTADPAPAEEGKP